jgi:hypothetical protein
MAAAVLSLALTPALPGIAATEQESKSAVAARELAQVLDAAKLDSIAAADPAKPGSWVAALYFKDGQLLVVSAQYAAPSLFVDKAKAREYRDIYIDLNSASVTGTKVFVQDQNADGIAFKPEGDAGADMWEAQGKTIVFDGEWKKAKLSEEEYQKTFANADDQYAKMLSLLIAQAKPKAGS